MIMVSSCSKVVDSANGAVLVYLVQLCCCHAWVGWAWQVLVRVICEDIPGPNAGSGINKWAV